MADHRKRAGFGRGRTDAHDDTSCDQDVGIRCYRCDDRACAKDRHPGQHHLLASEQVADGAEAEHQAGEGQCVAIDHPLQLTDRSVQLALHVGQDNGDNRVVEERQEEDEQEGRQGEGGDPPGANNPLRAFHEVNVT